MTLLYDTESLFDRSLTKLVRNPTLLGTNLAQPLLFLFLFSQLFQKLNLFSAGSGSYLTYLTPGIVIMNACISSAQSGTAIVNDLNSGFLQKVLLTPASRPAILLGRLMTDVFMVLVQSVMTIIAAMLLGVVIVTGASGILLILATAAALELALSGFFLALGMRTRRLDTVSAVGSVLFFPLIFVSSAMFPSSFFPPWAQLVSALNPVSYTADLTRGLIQGGLVWTQFASAYAVTGLIALATFAATLYQFEKVIS